MDIYFDNAATTPSLAEIPPTHFSANPSSPHKLGIDAERQLTSAKAKLSALLGCTPGELVLTSGGTESNNLGLIGYALANRRKQLMFTAAPWEHPSILEPLKFIQDQGLGHVNISSETPTSSDFHGVSHVNHETGDINPVETITKNIKAANPKAIIFVDGVQGFTKEPLPPADMLSISGHKFHGGTGVGALVVKKAIRLKPLFYGGSQEGGLRPGTENLDAVAHMVHAATTLWEQQKENHTHVATIKAILQGLTETLPGVCVNAMSENTSPYILNLSFLGLKGEILVHLLSQRGIYASMGAACQSRKKVKSTLEMMGFAPERASAAVRFSFSHLNTVAEAQAAKAMIIDCVTQMRKVLGVKL